MSSELTQEYLNEEEWWLEEGYASPEDVPVPDWHIALLKEREERYRTADKTKWKTWDEVEKELTQLILEEMKRRKK